MGFYFTFLKEYQPILSFIFMLFFYKINNTFSPFYNTFISIIHNGIILFCIGFSLINIINIVIAMSIKIRLIVGLILGGLCCLLSPLLWRRNKINKEKTIFNKITKKKKLKIKEYERNKKGEKSDNNNNEDEVIKSGSLSLVRKRKSYNNSEEEDNDEIESNSNGSYEESDHTKSSSEDSEKTYSDNKSDSEYDNFSFDRKFSKEHLYNSIEKIGIYINNTILELYK